MQEPASIQKDIYLSVGVTKADFGLALAESSIW